MPPWKDEWRMSHFHLWGWECSHSSAAMSRRDWSVFFLSEPVWGKQRSERKRKKRGSEHNAEIFSCNILLAITCYAEGSHAVPPFIRLESQPSRPLCNVAGVSLGERSDGVRPLWHRLLWSSLKSNEKEDSHRSADGHKLLWCFSKRLNTPLLRSAGDCSILRATSAPQCKIKLKVW